jgi:hypothetical protein
MPCLLGINLWGTVTIIITIIMDQAMSHLFLPLEEHAGSYILNVGMLMFCCNYYVLQKYCIGESMQTAENVSM